MIEPKLLMRSGLVISFIGHVAVLTLGLMFAGANPFAAAPADAISVDIVTPDEVGQAPSTPLQPAETTGALESPTPAPPVAQTPAALPQPPSQPTPRSSVERSAQPGRPPSQPLESVGLSQSFPPIAEEPNVSDMFGLPLALPDGRLGGAFDAPAIDRANVANDDIAAFHDHLKTCSTLPAGVNTSDDVKAVVRISLKPDGTLAAPPQPIRIEGVSKGGGVLYQSVVAALRKCQPYNMLPPDKYNEWKVFDLSFTPRSFGRG